VQCATRGGAAAAGRRATHAGAAGAPRRATCGGRGACLGSVPEHESYGTPSGLGRGGSCRRGQQRQLGAPRRATCGRGGGACLGPVPEHESCGTPSGLGGGKQLQGGAAAAGRRATHVGAAGALQHMDCKGTRGVSHLWAAHKDRADVWAVQ